MRLYLATALIATVLIPSAAMSASNLATPDDTEQSEGAGFLSDSWADTFAVISVVGVLLTAFGVFVAIRQMGRTVDANEAATDAAIGMLEENRSQYNKYVLAQARRLITEAKSSVKHREWSVAAMRLEDLGDLILQIASTDDSWGDLTERLYAMEGSFDRLDKDEITFTTSLAGKWLKLCSELRVKIGEQVGPFSSDD